jgi:beta-glucosidase
MKYLNGGWSYNWQGENSDTYAEDKFTILEAFQNKKTFFIPPDLEIEDQTAIEKCNLLRTPLK